MKMNNREEKTIYELFRFSIIIKALGSIVEIVAGTLIALIPARFVLNTALLFTQGTPDNDDFIAQGIIHAVHSFVVGNNLLIGAYWFTRGFVQLLLAIALLKNKIWAYPLLILVLTILVVTQTYDIYLSHSIATGFITAVDLITIYLVWHEYRIVERVRQLARKKNGST